MENNFKILSVNCQGLNDFKKRKDVFDFLRHKAFNIYCLQDTHFTREMEKIVYAQWGYKVHFSNYKSNARGTAILFHNNFEYKVIQEKVDINGNYLILDIIIQGNRISLVTLYGPNKDKPTFFENINLILDELGNEHIIMCGDFNLVLEPEIDTENYQHVNNPNARNKLLEIIENKNLIDAYRQLHETEPRFTWRKRNPRKQARLDFFLISENLLTFLNKSSIEHSYRSDHSSITLELTINEFKRGKGLWKFNNSLLIRNDYTTLIKNTINCIKEQYAIPVYNINAIGEIPDESLQFTINYQLIDGDSRKNNFIFQSHSKTKKNE